jgi:hypothetical protein
LALHYLGAGESFHDKKVLGLIIIYNIGRKVLLCCFYNNLNPFLIEIFGQLFSFRQLSSVSFILPERSQKV